MATRSSSNKGIDARNNAIPPAYINTQNTQAVRRIPDVPQGMQKELNEQQQAAPLPKDTLPQPQPVRPRRPMPQMDIFAETQRPSEPVTAGLPFGPGVNPQPQQQVLKAEEVRDFIYNSWLETGDDSLLEYI